MTYYKTRPGVFLTKICGEYLLVATKAAREYCPYVRQINKSAAYLWEKVQQSVTDEELENAFMETYHIQKERARKNISSFLKALEENGYILQEPDETESNER